MYSLDSSQANTKVVTFIENYLLASNENEVLITRSNDLGDNYE